ncbi:HNH endonuclease [Pseudomonas poae]|uniref:5-methylcytosine-specific restriction enzyme A n=1 Tax=Pseudomonas poae TaxID=200451 RepID=A0ABY0S0Q5_9PSED|nr:HNH endonuclease signature motif containing protein [Pseudomonas poae]KRP47780.1 HNH endonuclease [Pseudomonas poae]SDO68873.1 5-methylcytosine-specific restriction enzyme A [Pseudomonas poae]
MDIKKDKTDWSDAELAAAVEAYLKMWVLEKNGQMFNKAFENRLLREGAAAGRTESSIEFRMQNISTVLVRMGWDRIKGYRPAKNVGSGVERRIRYALAAQGVFESEDAAQTADEQTLIRRAAKLQQQPFPMLPDGIAQPQKVPTVSTAFVRDPKVRAWVLKEADGICEGCGSNAPFEVDGLPFLEVHHVKHLAQKGSDRIANAVALCPNCHQRCHRSSDRDAFNEALYANVGRLARE